MPSTTVYLPDAELAYVRELRDDTESIENVSQALQRIIWDHKQESDDE